MNKIIRVISIVLISAFLSLLLFSSVSFAKKVNTKYDWYQWRGPNRDGVSSEKDWLITWTEDNPKQLWKVSVGTGFSAVSVSKDRVYTMGNANKTDTVYCLDANTG
ncbi:MAG: outer membrane protein assembly factor BamB, partial [Candidatus Poribacteria bacterium]|nr:outer membrane protein assembly factor BamB [Candidatus Poribacteria bacterium]